MNHKDYLITIDGAQHREDYKDTVSMSTVGRYWRENDLFFISYDESAATGFEGDVTSLMIEADKKVTMSRQGSSNTQLIIECGRRHLSHYNTMFGGFTVGINADKIQNSLGENGGELKLCYSLDLNASDLSVNELNITVKEI